MAPSQFSCISTAKARAMRSWGRCGRRGSGASARRQHEILVPRQRPFDVDDFCPSFALGRFPHGSVTSDITSMPWPPRRSLIAEPSAHYRGYIAVYGQRA